MGYMYTCIYIYVCVCSTVQKHQYEDSKHVFLVYWNEVLEPDSVASEFITIQSSSSTPSDVLVSNLMRAQAVL